MPGVGVHLFPLGVIIWASHHPMLNIIEAAARTFRVNFVTVLVKPRPGGDPVADKLQEGAFVPVRHFVVLQICADIIPVKLSALVDVPGYK